MLCRLVTKRFETLRRESSGWRADVIRSALAAAVAAVGLDARESAISARLHLRQVLLAEHLVEEVERVDAGEVGLLRRGSRARRRRPPT